MATGTRVAAAVRGGLVHAGGQFGDYEDCEVKVNGDLHEPSAAALAAMNWPRTARMSTAKVFLLLVHPQEDGGK
jgi:hypothetical protein